MTWRYVPLQFPYVIKLGDNGAKNKYFEISMGYIFVVYCCRNTTSCGQRDNFRSLYVHNLLIGYLADSISSFPLNNKKRGGLNATFFPSLSRFIRQDLVY